MTPAALLATLRSYGHRVRAEGGKILVTDAVRLSSQERAWLTEMREAVLVELAEEAIDQEAAELSGDLTPCGCLRRKGQLVAVCAGCWEECVLAVDAYHCDLANRVRLKARIKVLPARGKVNELKLFAGD